MADVAAQLDRDVKASCQAQVHEDRKGGAVVMPLAGYPEAAELSVQVSKLIAADAPARVWASREELNL